MTSQMGGRAIVIIIMGVSGSGKTTIGSLLARTLGWTFQDADSFHSPENIAKMSRGLPLTDADRAPWLAELNRQIRNWAAAGVSTVLACSALKDDYRETLARGVREQTKFVYLRGSQELILGRLQGRGHHFMKANMLKSQWQTLEEPRDALVVDAAPAPEAIVQTIRARLGL